MTEFQQVFLPVIGMNDGQVFGQAVVYECLVCCALVSPTGIPSGVQDHRKWHEAQEEM